MMRSPAKRIPVLALLALVVLVPACSKEEPPAPAPQPVAPPAPAPEPRRDVEPPEAGEWEVADAGDGDASFLSAEEINARQLLRTIYFDYDRSEIRGDQRATLQANADWLREHPNVRILVEGHCDERGTREYNLGLGERRGNSVNGLLSAGGATGNQLNVVSYGEERPVCRVSDEDCWWQNRRVEIVYTAR